MQKYSDCPQILRDFLIYHEVIKGQSPKTLSEYHLDLRMFLRFVKLMRHENNVHVFNYLCFFADMALFASYSITAR